MIEIPFLKPKVIPYEKYVNYLKYIDESKIYSNYGPLNRMFEDRILLEYFNGIGAVTTVNNATTGLILAINELKRPRGKYALMPSFTFSATPLAAMWCGLEPYFIDIDENTWEMDRDHLSSALNRLGDEVAIVIPYATFGNNIDLSYYSLIHQQGIPVVIDAAPGFGASDQGTQFGQDFSGAVVYSFHATKPFGIGEGGLVYSSDEEIIHKVRASGNFGYLGTRESKSMGLNSKLPELFAAIGLATLDHLSEKIASRLRVIESYQKELEAHNLISLGWKTQQTTGQIPHQFFSVLCPVGEYNDYYIKKLGEKKIQALKYFSPACHEQEQFIKFFHSDLTITEGISKRILSLPFWEGMEQDTISRIIKTLIS
ncbi:aminotransferase DegT [Bacillus canaveralius]|uniref:Aminotransferase DegT n=1 Tax=Bacillus canaveralius TaxID=1403243 RepID=A0A2N5GMK1_9BACI|nr:MULTISPECIES: aminotransferase class I/II-fold pyridoxal phosphate-dependent enzyme [Bacillus]PLR82576.1 aminotransferase DegT [Bacillus sp. V33-4]PLR83167.1 aminotransferase DegT [Bacillus canaveralius]PLR94085.1 aminotransferase DegT [Bacillus canaveralius]RSK54115.1 aminotransferase class I/II-fold pyridoxal phosphate-dependent enzyme [Bacillus canaveralius]